MAGFKLPPMMLTDDEALALSVGLVAARNLGFSEAAPAVASAQSKLERILPAALKKRVRAVNDTVRLDLMRHAPAPGGTVLATLSAAAMACQRVHLRYTAPGGVPSARELDPYGVAFHAGAWYVLGMCHLRSAIRSFRLDRVQQVELRAASFARLVGVDVLSSLRQSVAKLARKYQVEVLLHTDLATAAIYFDDTIGMFDSAANGVLLRSETDDLDWFAARLAALPCDFEVRQPDALRASLLRLGERLSRLAAIESIDNTTDRLPPAAAASA